MRAVDIASTAAKLVAGSRADTHGDKVVNHSCIAEMVNGYLRARQVAGKPVELGPEDVANFMECLKIARRLVGAFNPDDYVDGAGYAACAGEIRATLERRVPDVETQAQRDPLGLQRHLRDDVSVLNAEALRSMADRSVD